MRAIRKINISENTANAVLKGHEFPMRKIEARELKAKLIIKIPLIAKSYGARYDLTNEVLKEAVVLLLNHFPMLGIDEIDEAYRSYAVGDLQGNAEMYGGEFNVAQLGKVLSLYREKRKSIF